MKLLYYNHKEEKFLPLEAILTATMTLTPGIEVVRCDTVSEFDRELPNCEVLIYHGTEILKQGTSTNQFKFNILRNPSYRTTHNLIVLEVNSGVTPKGSWEIVHFSSSAFSAGKRYLLRAHDLKGVGLLASSTSGAEGKEKAATMWSELMIKFADVSLLEEWILGQIRDPFLDKIFGRQPVPLYLQAVAILCEGCFIVLAKYRQDLILNLEPHHRSLLRTLGLLDSQNLVHLNVPSKAAKEVMNGDWWLLSLIGKGQSQINGKDFDSLLDEFEKELGGKSNTVFAFIQSLFDPISNRTREIENPAVLWDVYTEVKKKL